MKEKQSEHFIIYYVDDDKIVLNDVIKILEDKYKYITDFLEFHPKDKTEIFIYPNQQIFQTKKYGFILLLLRLDWLIGDNIGEKVIIVSPRNPGKVHDYYSVVKAIPHEFVHALNYQINPNCSKWINEGLALYAGNPRKIPDLLNRYNIPLLEEIKTNNPLKFVTINGYQYAGTYINFLNNNYGKEKVLQLLKNSDGTSGIEKILKKKKKKYMMNGLKI